MEKRFGYLADPVCIVSLGIYALNRFVLKPEHIGGWLTAGYLNDVLCLPLFLPMILRVQRMIGLRRHDGFPRAWEIVQHWIVFSIVFEVVIPRFPNVYASTADPWDVVAYAIGGSLAGGWWSWRSAPGTGPSSSPRYPNRQHRPVAMIRTQR